MKKLIFTIGVLVLGLAACNSSDSSVAGNGSGLTGADALNSVSNFRIQDNKPVLEWSANSADDLDFEVQACGDTRCFPMFKINCAGQPHCRVSDEWRSGGEVFSHDLKQNDDNGQRSYRLEICDADQLGLRSSVQIQIQAKNSFGTGPWVTGSMMRLSMDGYCHREHDM